MTNIQTIPLKTSARIIQLLGQQLISSDIIALYELIKNAYDANARKVIITFEGNLKKNSGKIIIKDDGDGMTIDTVLDCWWTIGTDFKLYQNNVRKYLGDKGIGRFSASRLARNLILYTKSKTVEEEVVAKFDWEDYSDSKKYLEDVKPELQTRKPIKIKESGGTILELTELYSNWDEEKLRKMKKHLSRFINPVKPIEDFEIFLNLPENYKRLSGKIESSKILETPIYLMKGVVKEGGSLEYNFTTIKNKSINSNIIEQLIPTKATIISSFIPFEFELRVWDLDRPQIKDLASMLFLTQKDIEEEIKENSGVKVYRNNFRILPYGDPGNDWLNLNLRRVQKMGVRVSNNQLICMISLDKNKTTNLDEQTNREGFIENEDFHNLKSTILLVINKLEVLRLPLKSKRIEREKKVKEIVFSKIKLTNKKKQALQKKRKKTIKKLELISKRVKNIDLLSQKEKVDFIQEVIEVKEELEKQIGEEISNTEIEIEELDKIEEKLIDDKIEEEIKFVAIKDNLQRYRRLSTLGLLFDQINHEKTNVMFRISTIFDSTKIKYRKIFHEVPEFENCIRAIDENLSILDNMFKKINPLTGQKNIKPEKIIVEDYIKNLISYYETKLNKAKIDFFISPSKTELVYIKNDLAVIITNMLLNSIYWLEKDEENKNKLISIEITEDNDSINLIFSDNGLGIEEEFKEKIFIPYESKKENGFGLGLVITKDTIENYGGTIELIDGPLKGANFKIVFRK